MKKYIASSLLILPAFALAQTALQNFNMNAFSQCQAVVKKCPKTGPVLDAQCVSKVLSDNHFCAPLSQVSKETNVSADQIDAQNYGNLTLLTLHYPADGKVNYSVIAHNQLVDFNVNLLTVDPALTKKYPDEKLFSVITAKPTYSVSASGDRQFSAPIRITKNCVACQTLETGKVIFHFDVHGKFIASQIVTP